MRKALVFVALMAIAASASASTVSWLFTENWESGYPNGWTDIGNTPFTYTNAKYYSPNYSIYSPGTATPTTRIWKNTGVIVAPIVIGEWWMYDTTGGSGGRQYCEMRTYSGKAYGSGSLTQLYAAGIYNTVTAPGETYKGTKYQARVAFGTGGAWFNLDAPGSPNRSVGWHKFTVRIDTQLNKVDFYVDDIFARSWVANWQGWIDSAIIGSGLTSSGRDAYYDDYRIGIIPEPGSVIALGTGLIGLLSFARRRK